MYPSSGFLMRQYRTGLVEGKSLSRIYVYLTTEAADVSIERDEFTDAPKDINVTGVDSHGWDTTYKVSVVYGYVSWINPAAFEIVAGKIAGADMGDLVIGGLLKDVTVYQAVMNDDRAYLLIDGDNKLLEQKVRPVSIMPNRVHGPTSLEVKCNVVKAQ